MKWYPRAVRFSGVPEDHQLIEDFYARPGVYVYVVHPEHAGEGTANVYAGKAGKLGWRMIEHATATLGLMNELYGEDGQTVFPKSGDSHFRARIEAFSGRYAGESLEHWQAVARAHLSRMEFWWLEMPVDQHRAAEGELVHRIKTAAAADSAVRCVNSAGVKRRGGQHVPAAPPDSFLERLLRLPVEAAG